MTKVSAKSILSKKKAAGDDVAAPKAIPTGLAALMASSGAQIADEASIPDGAITTGLPSLDRILGGGWALHRINELVGESGAGKTTLALMAVREVQRRGQLAVWADPENSFNVDLARACGVDMSRLIYLGAHDEKNDRARSGEEFCSFVEDAVDTGEVGLVVLDSIGALRPKKKMEKDFGEVGAPAQRAVLVGSLAEVMVGTLAGHQCALLGINHLTGLLQSDFHGNQKTTTKGGKTWNYLKTVSVSLKAAKTEEAGGIFTAEVTAEVLKCRRAPRGGKTDLLNVMGLGFSAHADMIEMGFALGILEGKSWINLGDRKFNGRAKLMEALAADAELETLLRDSIEAASL